MAFLWALAAICSLYFFNAHGASTQETNALLDFGLWNTTLDTCEWDGITCNAQGNVTGIYVENKKPNGSLPASIGNLSSLVNLTLKYNSFTGEIPSSITQLKSLQLLDLTSNQLSGSIPASIGNLSSLITLQININSLTGEIPTSITNLKSLQFLNLGSNQLSGSIPEDIGELLNLRDLYLDTNNLSGPIPASMGNLFQLETTDLSTNFLTGTIPAELGRMKNLTQLLLHANKLNGTMPSSFANLTRLQKFTLSNNDFWGNVSFVESMSALEQLWLQRNNFSGSIPNATFSKMKEFDFGFNSFTGSIPASLATEHLERFSVGHNRLTGSIPSQFSSLANLSKLDVSHNSLTGSTANLTSITQIDLSFNYFTDEELNCESSNGVSASALGVCSPSKTGSKSSYGINAGGNTLTNGSITFQADASTGSGNSLRTTGLFTIGDNWFLEISGRDGGTSGSASSQDIYKSIRWSSSYIAYHGTQLRNGRYEITLHFAELLDAQVDYRIFDILVQGNTVVNGLDVAKLVGQNKGYQISTEGEVTNGLLSIELRGNRDNWWDPKLTGPMISALFVSSVKNEKKRSILGIILGTIGSVVFLLLLSLILVIIKKRKRTKRDGNATNTTTFMTYSTADYATTDMISKIGPTVYTYKQLFKATDGFNENLLLGNGGFGAVYKGTLPDGSVVAVKHLTKNSRKNAETFKKEIAILSMLQHRNLVGIKGYCLQSDKSFLVCDYLENGSLDKFLFNGPVLNWQARRNIAIEAACGLLYLHEESRYQVIHCDVKPANILLDKDLNAYIGDFGLAKLYKERVTGVMSTKVGGTVGYMAPEYANSYELSEKADVYSFGVVLLELLSGRLANGKETSLVEEAHEVASLELSNLLSLVDEKLDEFQEKEAMNMGTIALLCTQQSPEARPRMRDVWLMLSDKTPILPLPPKSTHTYTESVSSSILLSTCSYSHSQHLYSDA